MRTIRGKRMRRAGGWLVLATLLLTVVVTSCTSVDCPLNNTVYTTYSMQKDTLTDTLSVAIHRVDGTDSIVLNQLSRATSFILPISYTSPADTLFFNFNGAKGELTDTLVVSKTNTPHFESTDCPMSYFHTITNISYTRNGIDSVAVNHKDVTYDETQVHFLIRFKNNLH